jgi:hypothetical protein
MFSLQKKVCTSGKCLRYRKRLGLRNAIRARHDQFAETTGILIHQFYHKKCPWNNIRATLNFFMEELIHLQGRIMLKNKQDIETKVIFLNCKYVSRILS